MAKHKHYDAIVAWAKGKTIQYKHPHQNPEWTDFASPASPAFYEHWQYRVKPDPVMFRLYTYPDTKSVGVTLQNYSSTETRFFESLSQNKNVIWLTDWMELPEKKEE